LGGDRGAEAYDFNIPIQLREKAGNRLQIIFFTCTLDNDMVLFRHPKKSHKNA
jgi:hypothetical protein